MINKVLRFLILNIKDRKIVKRFKQLRVSQSLSKDDIVKNQLYSLNKLLNHAYNNVPYYRSLIKDTGLLVNNRIELNNIDSFKALPFLSKDIIREQQDKLYDLKIEARQAFRNTSGGSTGEPVVFMQDSDYLNSNLTNTYLARSWRGAGLYDSTIVLWGAERDTFTGKKPLKAKVKDIFLNTIRLNTFVLSDTNIKQYIKILNKKKPKLVIAYVQSIYEMAKFAKENNLLVNPQKSIHVAAGTLYPFMREEIESVFGCKVFNHYGSREAGAIASECSAHNGLHIMMDHTLVEVVDENGSSCKPGEEGDIVITTLNNYAMPLIRYKIGDRGVLAKEQSCDCHCNYPKLENITGRVTDLFKTAQGGRVDGEFFTHLFYFINGVKLFQVIQSEINKIEVKIVKCSDIQAEELANISNKIKIVMGDNCKVDFNFVDEIPKTATGKHLYTISLISN